MVRTGDTHICTQRRKINFENMSCLLPIDSRHSSSTVNMSKEGQSSDGSEMKKFMKVVLILISLLVLQLTTIPTTASAEPIPIVENSKGNTSGVISKFGLSSTLAVTPATTPCTITADHVHWSESVPGSIKANAWVLCTGTSFTITSFQVTLYKSGFITHYISGPIISGTAYSNSKFWYLVFPMACSNSTSSSYWSKAVVSGYYAGYSDLSTGTSWSGARPLDCGTTW